MSGFLTEDSLIDSRMAESALAEGLTQIYHNLKFTRVYAAPRTVCRCGPERMCFRCENRTPRPLLRFLTVEARFTIVHEAERSGIASQIR